MNDSTSTIYDLDAQLENDREFLKMREHFDALLDGLPAVDIAHTLNTMKKSKRKRRKKAKPARVSDNYDDDDGGEDGEGAAEEKTAIDEVIDEYDTVGEAEHLYSVEGTLENLIRQQTREEQLAIEAARRNLSTLMPESSAGGLSADKALAALRIDNMVTVTTLSQRIDCAFVAARGSTFGFGFNKKRFAAAVNRHRISNRDANGRVLNTTVATTMTFPTGKIITTGAKRFDVAVQATEKTCDFISKMRADNDSFPYLQLRATKIRIKNVVASTSLFFKIDVKKLQEKNPGFVHYEEEEWIGAIMELNQMSRKYAKRCVTVLAFGPGSLVFTGTNGYADCVEIFVDVFPYLRDCAIIDESLQKMIEGVPTASIQKFVGQASDGERSQMAMISTSKMSDAVVSRKRKEPTVSATARNIIALDTMSQHEQRKSESAEAEKRKKSLLEDLRSNSKNLTSSSKRTELRTQPMPQHEALGLAHETN